MKSIGSGSNVVIAIIGIIAVFVVILAFGKTSFTGSVTYNGFLFENLTDFWRTEWRSGSQLYYLDFPL